MRLEELPASRRVPDGGTTPDRYEVGVALDRESTTEDLLEFFEEVRQGSTGRPS